MADEKSNPIIGMMNHMCPTGSERPPGPPHLHSRLPHPPAPQGSYSRTTRLIEMAGLQTTFAPIGAELNKPGLHWAAGNG